MSSKKILLVDDESDISDFLSYNLKSAGYSVKVASNGEEGISIAKTFEPDLILLDMMMPEMDGIETCEKILRNQFGYTAEAIETFKHPRLKGGK